MKCIVTIDNMTDILAVMPGRVCISVYKKRSLFLSKIVYVIVVHVVIIR